MQRKIQRLAAIVKQDPGVDTVLIFTGGGGGTTTNTGRVFIALKPLKERKATADQIVNRLRPKLAVVPGATLVSAGGAGRQHRRQAKRRSVPIHRSTATTCRP